MTAIHDAVSPLTALGIKSSYQNEGDPFEEDWQEGTVTTSCRFRIWCAHRSSTLVFFGYKYSELSSIKQKYDPQNCESILALFQDIDTN